MDFCSQTVLANLILSPRTFLRRLLSPTRISIEEEVEARSLYGWLGSADQSVQVGKTALILSLLPQPYCLKMELLLARGLQSRGYRVVVLTNLACQAMAEAYHSKAGGLEVRVLESYAKLGSVARARCEITSLFQTEEGLLARIKGFRYRDAYTGLHSLATLSALSKGGSTPLEVHNRTRLRRILQQSIGLSDAANAALSDIKPTLVLGLEKGFVGTAEIFYAALSTGIEYVQWVSCHEPNSIMLKRYRWGNCREHPFSISDSAWERILALPWDEAITEAVMTQFERGYKDGAWFKYKNLSASQQQSERQELIARLGLDPAKKTAVIYSHILNDANLFYGQDLFEGGFAEWLIETVRAAAENSSVNWVLKLHPANVYRNAKIGYTGKYGELLALEEAFGEVPKFLHLVYPDEKTSPLSFFRITDYGITVRGTVGLELPCFGIPVLTAGTGRYAGKGFTIDSVCRDEYLSRVRRIQDICALSEEQRKLGLRYAYFVFRARPAKYGEMFSDVYNFPLNHHRSRDIVLGDKPLEAILGHPQMQNIMSFLCSHEEDFLDIPESSNPERDVA